MLAVILVVITDIDHDRVALAFDHDVAIRKLHVSLVMGSVDHATLVVLRHV
jgi:hypothetical protein